MMGGDGRRLNGGRRLDGTRRWGWSAWIQVNGRIMGVMGQMPMEIRLMVPVGMHHRYGGILGNQRTDLGIPWGLYIGTHGAIGRGRSVNWGQKI